MKIRIGTRGSDLAMWQARHVAGRLGEDRTEIIVIKTQGDHIQNVSFDKMEGKGFFTKEIEEALLSGKVDLAVHSLKDLPTENPKGLAVAAISEREDPSDLLLIRREKKADSFPLPLDEGAVVGTSSMRRMAQLKSLRPDLKIEALRGNVNTRLRKLRERVYDAIVLAAAGLKRLELDLSDLEIMTIPYDVFLPAPGQGALALQIRGDDAVTRAAVETLNDEETRLMITAERSFLNSFGGGCHIPLGARAVPAPEGIRLEGVVAAPDGSKAYRESVAGPDPVALGIRLAMILKEKGADALI
jgi:hydroxymethylbilane synthase